MPRQTPPASASHRILCARVLLQFCTSLFLPMLSSKQMPDPCSDLTRSCIRNTAHVKESSKLSLWYPRVIRHLGCHECVLQLAHADAHHCVPACADEQVACSLFQLVQIAHVAHAVSFS